MTLSALTERQTTSAGTVTAQDYRQGMASVAAAVNIVTTSLNGTPAGFTATAVCSVSDDPATLLVCLNRQSSVHKAFSQSRYLAVNTLAAGQDDLSNLFGGRAPMAERFAQGNWSSLSTGSPALSDAAVTFDCEIIDIKSVATHDVFYCQVVAIAQRQDTGALLYYQRGYCQLA
ncbi:MAG: FMN reductase [Alteromonadaceae bacterium]|nr:FMN reductase [Alteromonadaceae bacterium]|tara:strand:- start:418 stop:939 length:522 start_codon:yes stop_codon:yes gene_type:complete